MKGSDVVRIRKAAGLTQEEAAEILKVDRSTLAKWETGDRSISRMAKDAINTKLVKKKGAA